MKNYSVNENRPSASDITLRKDKRFAERIALFVLLAFFLFTMPFFCSCSFTARNALSDDVTIETELIDLGTSSPTIKYVITPKCDIENLELTTIFYNSSSQMNAYKLTSITYTVGDVQKGQKISESKSLSGLGSDAIKVVSAKTTVSDGTTDEPVIIFVCVMYGLAVAAFIFLLIFRTKK